MGYYTIYATSMLLCCCILLFPQNNASTITDSEPSTSTVDQDNIQPKSINDVPMEQIGQLNEDNHSQPSQPTFGFRKVLIESKAVGNQPSKSVDAAAQKKVSKVSVIKTKPAVNISRTAGGGRIIKVDVNVDGLLGNISKASGGNSKVVVKRIKKSVSVSKKPGATTNVTVIQVGGESGKKKPQPTKIKVKSITVIKQPTKKPAAKKVTVPAPSTTKAPGVHVIHVIHEGANQGTKPGLINQSDTSSVVIQNQQQLATLEKEIAKLREQVAAKEKADKDHELILSLQAQLKQQTEQLQQLQQASVQKPVQPAKEVTTVAAVGGDKQPAQTSAQQNTTHVIHVHEAGAGTNEGQSNVEENTEISDADASATVEHVDTDGSSGSTGSQFNVSIGAGGGSLPGSASSGVISQGSTIVGFGSVGSTTNHVCYDKTEVACESTSTKLNALVLNCKNGGALKILGGNYGRTDVSICANENTDASLSVITTNCVSGESLQLINSLCNDKLGCFVNATDAVFGNPCAGVFKYLTISYRCCPNFASRQLQLENNEQEQEVEEDAGEST